ncbi:MAG: hypothetical protein KDD94_14935, partial [Calditrichaeota bacterium]|nr:hypothetical protein [Calditrichota bacterium]
MKLLSLLFILVALISCDQQLESGLEPGEASFKISLNLNENPYSKQIKKIIGELKRNNESVVFDFDIDPDNSLAKA